MVSSFTWRPQRDYDHTSAGASLGDNELYTVTAVRFSSSSSSFLNHPSRRSWRILMYLLTVDLSHCDEEDSSMPPPCRTFVPILETDPNLELRVKLIYCSIKGTKK